MTRSARTRWTLHRRADSARCVLCAIGDRVELQITMAHEVVMSQQCSGPDEAAAISSAWWLALVNRGWVDHTAGVIVRPKPDRRRAEPATQES